MPDIMKRALLIIGMIMMWSFHVRGGENLFRDGGFEEVEVDSSGKIIKCKDWSFYTVEPTNHGGIVKFSIDKGYIGKNSLKIEINKGPVGWYPLSTFFLLEPNTKYKFSCYLKAENLVGYRWMSFCYTSMNRKQNHVCLLPYEAGKYDWKKIEGEFTTPSMTEFIEPGPAQIKEEKIRFNFFCYPGGDGTVVWFDEFRLEAVGRR